jgi:deoxyribodipyrimidine photo-lyase
MGWQWTAGCGPDASPFFRVFNPETQAEKFDPDRRYRDRYLNPSDPIAASFYDAAPRSWRLDKSAQHEKLIELKAGRERALAAYKDYTTDGRENAQNKQKEQA